MSKTLEQIAQQLRPSQVTKKTVTKETKKIPPKEVEEIKPVPKVQLIYAFNGTGKTRLSRMLKDLVAPVYLEPVEDENTFIIGHAGEETADITDEDKENLDELVKFLSKTYGFNEEAKQNG